MINRDDATQHAERLLTEITETVGDPLAWFDGAFGVETIEEHPHHWVFRWNSVAYLRTGDVMDQILAGPIVIPKDGSTPWMMGTADDQATQLSRRSPLNPTREVGGEG
jgi:hypothetical protein